MSEPKLLWANPMNCSKVMIEVADVAVTDVQSYCFDGIRRVNQQFGSLFHPYISQVPAKRRSDFTFE
jgi:hypothetical protein